MVEKNICVVVKLSGKRKIIAFIKSLWKKA